jgi:hypothetical protein
LTLLKFEVYNCKNSERSKVIKKLKKKKGKEKKEEGFVKKYNKRLPSGCEEHFVHIHRYTNCKRAHNYKATK